MRILTVMMGILLTGLGLFSVAQGGMSFLALAFPIGVALILVGIVICFAYRSTVESDENRHWVLIEGLTTFILGVVVLTGQLAADVAVPVVFGLWSMISGIRGFVVGTQVQSTEKKDVDFYWMLTVSILNLAAGLYTFFNSQLMNWSVLTMLGIIFVIQGVNTIKIGADIPYRKPDVIKTKDEQIASAEAAAEKARREAKRAIRRARKAQTELNVVKEEAKEFHEIIQEPLPEE